MQRTPLRAAADACRQADGIPFGDAMLLALPFLSVTVLLLPALGWLSLYRSAAGAATPTVRALATQSLIAQAVIGRLAALALLGSAVAVPWSARLTPGTVAATAVVVAAALVVAWLEARRLIGAALLSASVFGAGHLSAGWSAMAVSGGFAVALQGLVQLSGGLATAILAHATEDLLAAWLVAVLLRPRPSALPNEG